MKVKLGLNALYDAINNQCRHSRLYSFDEEGKEFAGILQKVLFIMEDMFDEEDLKKEITENDIHLEEEVK